MRKFKAWFSGLSKGGKFFFIVAVIGVVWIFGSIASADENDNPPEEESQVTAQQKTEPEPVVETKTIIKKIDIPFESTTVEDPDLEKGKERIITTGINGQKHFIYEQKIVDGDKVLIEEKVILEPVNQVKAIGTKVAVAPQSSCDSNYSGACVPVASDVDCASGSGNGPAYVNGPVYVTGYDHYDLDRDGNGVACE